MNISFMRFFITGNKVLYANLKDWIYCLLFNLTTIIKQKNLKSRLLAKFSHANFQITAQSISKFLLSLQTHFFHSFLSCTMPLCVAFSPSRFLSVRERKRIEYLNHIILYGWNKPYN